MISSEIFYSTDSDSDNVSDEDRRSIFKGIRDASNPLELPNNIFVQLFRVNKPIFLYLLRAMEPKFKTNSRSSSMPNAIKIATALRFFGQGSYQSGVGQDFTIGLSQPSVSKVLTEVLDIMEETICSTWICFNRPENVLQETKEYFLEKFRIPGVIGCVDGTHLSIIKPSENEHLCVNRKGTHSINVMVVCDQKMKFICVDGRFQGSSHDSFVWRHCQMRHYLEERSRNGERNSWLLRDSGYPLEPWLITPYRSTEEGTREASFNSIHSKARCIVERSIGLLKARFRCCSKARVLHYAPQKCVKIVNCCAALHNMCITNGVDPPEQITFDNSDDHASGPDLEQLHNESEARHIRNMLRDSIC